MFVCKTVIELREPSAKMKVEAEDYDLTYREKINLTLMPRWSVQHGLQVEA